MATASAPASSANLGPGFDTIALALDLRCSVSAEPASEWSVEHRGPELFEGAGEEDAVLAAARRVTDESLRLVVDNHIPLSRGLGSSAAAFTAGALAAMRATGRSPSHDELFEVVGALEGHPDNAAAAVYGGLVAVAGGAVIHLTVNDGLVPVVAVPGAELRTSDARRVLPATYDIGVVSRTLGRVTALVEGLRTAAPELLTLAAGDELHEAPRAGLGVGVARLIEAALSAGALHAAWSGAGPSVISFVPTSAVAEVLHALESAVDEGGRILVLDPDEHGAL